jgi:cytochrome bd-type quinol oxidase subunit 2
MPSSLLKVGFGAAVGCVIRGVPPTVGSRILFAALCGGVSLAVLTLLSAAWTAMKSEGELQLRSRDRASRAWWAVLFCLGIVTAATFAVQPDLLDRLQSDSLVPVFAVFVLAGLMGARLCMKVGFDLGTFAGTSCTLAGLLVTVLK